MLFAVHDAPKSPCFDMMHATATRIFTDGGAEPNPGICGCGATIADGRFKTAKRPGCTRKRTLQISDKKPF